MVRKKSGERLMRRINCNLCGSNNCQVLYEIPDINYATSPNLFTYIICKECGLVYQNPQLESDELLHYYPNDYSCYQASINPLINSKISAWMINLGFQKRWNFVLSQKAAGKLLDIGCATGNFLNYAISNKFWNLTGLELNKVAVDAARSKGLHIIEGSIDSHPFKPNEFDAVTLWDVLEHLNDPHGALTEIAEILKPEGIIVIRCPRLDSWDYRIFRQNWHGFEAPRHLFVFSKTTILRLVKEAGFQILKVSGEFGSYMTFILDLKFWLISKGYSRSKISKFTKVLYNPFARLLLTPIFAILGQIFHGPSITIVARKS